MGHNIAVLSLLLTSSMVLGDYWTSYRSRDRPTGNGDNDSRGLHTNYLRSCLYPNGVQCTPTPFQNLQKPGFDCTTHLGLICLNKDNQPGGCNDYSVRYRCPSGSGNPCTVNNGGCSQMCNYCPGCGEKTCSCHPGFTLMSDGHTCRNSNPSNSANGDTRMCIVCETNTGAAECGSSTNSKTTVASNTMQLPCRSSCFRAKWRGQYFRGCGEYPPYPAQLFLSDPINNKIPPYDSGRYTYSYAGSQVEVDLCYGDYCNADSGTTTLVAGYGVMASPLFTGLNIPGRYGNYENNADTKYYIVSPHGLGIKFTFFNIEGTSTCLWDWLKVLKYGPGGAAIVPKNYQGKMCSDYNHNNEPNLNQNYCSGGAKTIYVEFHTDSSVTRQGFRFNYFKC